MYHLTMCALGAESGIVSTRDTDVLVILVAYYVRRDTVAYKLGRTISKRPKYNP